MKTSDLIKKSHSKRGKPGTLKAKIDGPITKAKVRALKNRPGATTLDKKQANFYLNMNDGVNDPSIFKAVFLAGGPGSGKSFIVGKTALTALGFKVVNSDAAFENGLRKAGMEMSPENIYSPKGQEIRGRAKAVTKAMLQNYINGRLGLVIDGTGKDYEKISRQAKMLRELGYEVAMIFVNTDLDTALERNRMRSRSLPDKEVETMWKDVQKNLGKFQNFFRQKMFIVDNSTGANYEGAVMSTYRKISAWANTKPASKAAKVWMDKARGVKEDVAATSTASIPNPAKTAMGPRAKLIYMYDRRRKKDQPPVLLKRFRKYMEKRDG